MFEKANEAKEAKVHYELAEAMKKAMEYIKSEQLDNEALEISEYFRLVPERNPFGFKNGKQVVPGKYIGTAVIGGKDLDMEVKVSLFRDVRDGMLIYKGYYNDKLTPAEPLEFNYRNDNSNSEYFPTAIDDTASAEEQADYIMTCAFLDAHIDDIKKIDKMMTK